MRKSAWIWLGVALALCGLGGALIVLLNWEDKTPTATGPPAQLSAEIELDKPVYTRGEPVSATVTMTNYGLGPAEDTVVDCGLDKPGQQDVSTTFLAEREDQIRLDPSDGTVVEAGQSHTETVTGVVSPSAYNVGVVSVVCTVLSPSVSNTVTIQASAAVTGVSDEVSGRFTICRNDRNNGGAAGMRLTLEQTYEHTEQMVPPLETVTDADGRFTFPGVPAGPYQLSYAPPAGHQSNNPDLGNFVQLLVTGDGTRWQTEELSVTTKDPATSCV